MSTSRNGLSSRTPESAYPRQLIDLCLRGRYRESAMDILDDHVDRKRRLRQRAESAAPADCARFDQLDAKAADVLADLVEVCLDAIDRRLVEDGPSLFFKDFPQLKADPRELAADLVAADKDGRRRLMYVLTAAAVDDLW